MSEANGRPTEAEVEVARAVIRRHLERGEWNVRDGAPRYSSEADAALYLKSELAGSEREVFGCLFMDTRHRLIACERLFMGGVDRCTVHPREVLKAALGHNAAAALLFHCHPSGDPEPSMADVDLTSRVKGLLEEIEVRLLDHIVVADGRHVSMAARGLF